MSLQFSDTTTKKGILQLIERDLKLGDGYITGDAGRLLEFTADCNIEMDDIWAEIFECGGTWQFDDSNHTDYPIITTNLVSGQRDYTFTTDEQGNIILDIYKVLVADENGVFHEVTPKDAQSDKDTSGFWDGQDTQGSPYEYDKTANGIFLRDIPNYNYTNGLKVYINREGSYFTSTDTTKKPGFHGTLHSLVALRVTMRNAWRNSLLNVNLVQAEINKKESSLKKIYGKRERDVRRRLNPNVEDTR